MIGNDDIEVLIDEPITHADLFGEDEDEAVPIIPPLSPDPNLDGEEATNTAADGDAAATADDAQAKKARRQLNRLPNLNEKWITDPTKEGIHAVNKYFEGIKLKKGKGHELANLKVIMKRYEYWAQQCYPKLCFKDFVDKVENLSAKKLVKNALQEIRCNRTPDGDIMNNDDNDDENVPADDLNQGATNTFLNTTEPITSPAPFPIGTSSTPQTNINSNSTPMTDDMKEMIRRKREEAIAKRKRKMEESMNRTDDTSMSQSQPENSIGGERSLNPFSNQQSHETSMADSTLEIDFESAQHSSQKDKESESAGDSLSDIIQRKKEGAIAKRKRRLLEESICSSSKKEDIEKASDLSVMSQENDDKMMNTLQENDSYMSISEFKEDKTLTNTSSVSDNVGVDSSKTIFHPVDSSMSVSDYVEEKNDIGERQTSSDSQMTISDPNEIEPPYSVEMMTASSQSEDETMSSFEKGKMEIDN